MTSLSSSRLRRFRDLRETRDACASLIAQDVARGRPVSHFLLDKWIIARAETFEAMADLDDARLIEAAA